MEQAAPDPAPPEPPRSIEDRFWDFWARINPHLVPPRHFTVYVRRVLAGVGGDLRVAFAAPPQHGKTEVTLALIAFLVVEFPGRRWAYITYNQGRANIISRKFRRLMASAGVVVAGTLATAILPSGGQMLFTSVDGGITGEPVDGVAVIDDPYKGRKQADSEQWRQVVEDTYREAIETRLHPGASLFLLATRWHPQDLTGTVTAPDADEPFEYINLRAIADGPVNENGVVADDPNGRKPGEALFPERRPLEYLAKKRKRVLEFAWEALFQGRPRPKGGKVFLGVHYYRELPKHFSGGFGLDLAYSTKRNADDSSVVELLRADDILHPVDGEPMYFVASAHTKHVTAPEFAVTLRACHTRRPGFAMVWRCAGGEKGSADFLIEKGLPIEIGNSPGKLEGWQHCAPAWNTGHVLVPDPDMYEVGSREREELEAWLWPFLDCLHNVTGTGKEHDDPADALSNIFDELRGEEDSGGAAIAGGRKQH